MSDIRLQPPFDPQLLEAIIAKGIAHEGEDLSLTAEWLLHWNDCERMVKAIRDVWRASHLPLSNWANLITHVHAYTTDRGDCIWLDVALAGWEEHDVLQQAPFQPATLDACGWMQRRAIPSVMRDVALCAPGLKLKNEAMIGMPQSFIAPMESIRRWMDDEPVVVNDTQEELPLDFFIAEVAEDCLGNQIVLGSDERLYFFGHDVGTMFHCKVNLSELIAEFFRNPASLLNDNFLGVKW